MRCVRWLFLILLAGCSSSTADPIGIGSAPGELKRSRCAGGIGSPCSEITTPAPAGEALDRYRATIARQLG